MVPFSTATRFTVNQPPRPLPRPTTLSRVRGLLYAAQGGNRDSLGVGLFTALLIARWHPEYAMGLLAERLSGCSEEDLEQAQHDVALLVSGCPLAAEAW